MEEELRELFVKYGVGNVKRFVEKECRQIYEELHAIYEPKRKYERKVEAVIPGKVEENQESEKEKRKTERSGKANLGESLEKISECKIQENEKIQETPKPKKRGVFSKEEQEVAVEKKRAELAERGVDGMTLLTRENLESWLKSGKTYQGIARDHVGVHESIVSEKARSFGLRSMVSKYKFFRRSK
jgi:hypothetical protein